MFLFGYDYILLPPNNTIDSIITTSNNITNLLTDTVEEYDINMFIIFSNEYLCSIIIMYI